ncbi:MAG: hypothetical protein HOM96_05035 [Rickettsiales bacterium]|jgi:hypothetical protein|nr:hypothetical protein [Rickettsiales bacterium]
MFFLRNFFILFTLLFCHNANAYLAPLLGSAGAIAGFIAFIFAILASFAFLIWYHFRNFYKKIINKFSKKTGNIKPTKSQD